MLLSDRACENIRSYYTRERLDDFASIDPTFPQWKEECDRALKGEEVPITVYGADGLILDAAVGDPYILSGTFDSENLPPETMHWRSGRQSMILSQILLPGLWEKRFPSKDGNLPSWRFWNR